MTSTQDYEVTESRPVYRGRVISVRADEVRMSDGSVATRDVVEHPGAVAVVALDDEGRVVTVTQYRHPLQQRLVELPAGLLDVEGEPALLAAQRELAEEAGLAADEWHVLIDLFTSPGMCNEAVRIFLARGLHDSDHRFEPEHEELELTVDRRPLEELVADALAGRLTNSLAVAGVLAASHVRSLGLDRPDAAGFSLLRPGDAPWPARPTH